MLRRSGIALGFFATVKEELGKVPAYLRYKLQDSAKQHVESASKTFDFLKGNSPNDTPEVREKRQKHKEMYDALMKEQQAQAAELKAKHKARMDSLSWSQKIKALMAEAKEALQQMTSAKAGAMALLQHCTASHAAEVAVEQGIDVKNVRMVLEKQQKPNSLEYEEVVVGYIDAPKASEEEVFAFAEKLHKACPVANTMHIDWRRDLPETERPLGSKVAAAAAAQGDSAVPRAARTGPEQAPPSVDFQTFSREGMDSFDTTKSAEEAASAAASVPRGMPGSRRHASNSADLGHGAFGEDEGLHLPGVKPKMKGSAAEEKENKGDRP